MRKLPLALSIALTLALASACGGKNPTDLFPSTMEAVSSTTITAKAGTTVTLQVRVLTDKGAPVGHLSVTWSPQQGDVIPVGSITDASGIATTVWTLSPQVGQQTVTASAQFVSPVTFTATATQ
jgi:hypothetical protein